MGAQGEGGGQSGGWGGIALSRLWNERAFGEAGQGLADARDLLVVGEDQKMGGFAGEGLESEDSLLEQGLGGDQFEEVFGLGLSAEGPETLAGASRHDEEEERGHV